MTIRDEFEVEWARQVRMLKTNMDAILRERLEAWCAERNLTADIDFTIDLECDVHVEKLESAKREDTKE